MRRYHHIITAALLLSAASCQSDMELDAVDPSTTQTAITFTTSVAETRATQTDIDALEKYGKFNVAAFLDSDLYYADLVSYSNSTWSSDATRYWPVSGNLDFYAYSPLEDDNAGIVLNNSTSYSNYSLTYTCPKDIQDQIDLLVVSLTDQSYASSVELEFEHALSSIGFNVEFTGESNITLNTISINYIGIESEGIYNFADAEWDESTSPTYFSSPSADLVVNQTGTTTDSDKNIVFDIAEQLMIIPQAISDKEDDPHYISIQISYTLNSGSDGDSSGTSVVTGIAQLPAPTSDNEYAMGYLYTYNITISGETISIGTVTITDQEDPVAAYGNIDLGLITQTSTAADIGYSYSEDAEKKQYYYTTALRVKNLMKDGVRDFVVVGSMGADGESHLGTGKLGYYGDETSPFNIGATLAGLDEELFTIDLRGAYDFPEFQYANADEGSSEDTTVESTSTDIYATDPILTAGLFKNVTMLKEIILPNGLMAIGNHAFDNCDALEVINIADVKHIEKGAFQDASALQVVEDGNLTRVHDNGFDSCESLTTIDLSRVTQIDSYGFSNCAKLTEVNLSKLDDIGKYAFYGCGELTLESDTEIPAFGDVAEYAFFKCYNLAGDIDLTATTSVGSHAFNYCEHIKFADGSLDKMKTIEDSAFTGCLLIGLDQEISMKNITSIDKYAFLDCTALNIVEGLGNLTKIEKSVFEGCTSLTGYSATETADENKVLSLLKVTEVDNLGFSETALTSVEFNDGVLTTIGDNAFDKCASLTTLSGLSGVDSVGVYAFAGCSSLKELDLPAIEDGKWGQYFLSECSSLERVSLPSITINGISWSETDADGNVTYPYSSITSMLTSAKSTLKYLDLQSLEGEFPGWTFNSSALEEVNIASVTSIGNGAFQKCVSLNSIDASSATSVGSYAFQYCSSLTTLELPKLKTWGQSFFSDCTNLTVLSLPLVEENTVTYTYEDSSGNESEGSSSILTMVKSCTELETLLLPKVTGSIGGSWGGLFSKYNDDYTELIYHETLKYIDLSSISEASDYAFQGCTNLESLDLRGVTTVGASLFYDCENLKRLNISGLVDSSKINGGNVYGGPFWNFTNGTNCEIWLSDEQAAVAAAATADGLTWQGVTWKAIHKVSDNVEFVLKP